MSHVPSIEPVRLHLARARRAALSGQTRLALLLATVALGSLTAGCSRRSAPPEPGSATSVAANSAPSPTPPSAVSESRVSEGAVSEDPATENAAGRDPAALSAPRQKTLAPPLGTAPDAKGHYGDEFTGAPLRALGQVLAAPESYKDQTMTLQGVVQRVCTRKGCWMELASSAKPDAQRCRIRFKDYGFFVPRDAQGARAKVEGVFNVNRVAPARVKHLEEEGAVFDSKNPDGSANETQLIATAVELLR